MKVAWINENIAWQSIHKIYRVNEKNNRYRWLILLLGCLLLILFLPWTQNIQARGIVTGLRQEERKQELNTVISGSIVRWYVNEGDIVHKGDTLLQIGEVKTDYFDPKLISRTQEQINAKAKSKQEYLHKAETAEKQIAALLLAKQLKLQSFDTKIEQQRLKINSDSLEVLAAANESAVYKRQLSAGVTMMDSGAISLADYEKRKINYQNGIAKKNSADNKYQQSKKELLNLFVEKNAVEQDYIDKIAKTQGERFGTLSLAAATDAELAKLDNALSNYTARNQLYFICAPQSGQIVRASKAGIGEILKEGELVVELVPQNRQQAVELFITATDLQLVHVGQTIRFVFDGFPAIVFSGWPNNSYGTFGGKIAAIENAADNNGKFRILVTEDTLQKKWPAQLKPGTGASGIALLKEVPVYYELWRNINGFPPEYYSENKKKKQSVY